MMTRKSEKGLQFRDYLLYKRDSWLDSADDCSNAVQALPDDNSYLMEACKDKSEYIMSKNFDVKEARLYEHVLFEHGNLHVQLVGNSRLECDDFQPKHTSIGYNLVGQWLYYVR